MENQIQVFDNAEFGSVRAIEIDNEPWFVGRDVALALGYKNPRDALAKHVDAEDKKSVAIRDGIQGNPNMTIINEGGLYSLTVLSNMPNAKKFTRWLTHDVAVSIRKTGSYTLPKGDPRAVFTPTVLRQLADHIESLETQVAELRPKADYCEKILQSSETLPVTVIAKDYGMGAAEFNDLLRAFELQYKVGRTWVLRQPYANRGYVKTETKILRNGLTTTQSLWTQRGRMWLYHELKQHGFFPLIERQDKQTTLF